MKFIRKCLIFSIFICLCLIAYLLFPDTGHLDIVLLNYRVTVDLYIAFGIIVILTFLTVFLKSLIVWIKTLFQQSDKKQEIKTINNLARFIISDGKIDRNIDSRFNVCKSAVLVKNGIFSSYETGIPEIDVFNSKIALQQSMLAKDIDNAIKIAKQVANKFPRYLFAIKTELLEIAVTAVGMGRSFDFDPTRSKYNLSCDFINEYKIKTELVHADIITDGSLKLKTLERLYKKNSNNSEIARKLLSTLIRNSVEKNENQVLRIIENLFKIAPDRNLAFDFLQVYSKLDALEVAERLIAPVTNDNVEKIWFLLIVSTSLRLYPKMLGFINVLIKNEKNLNDLYTFFIRNYGILSEDDEIIKLLCK